MRLYERSRCSSSIRETASSIGRTSNLLFEASRKRRAVRSAKVSIIDRRLNDTSRRLSSRSSNNLFGSAYSNNTCTYLRCVLVDFVRACEKKNGENEDVPRRESRNIDRKECNLTPSNTGATTIGTEGDWSPTFRLGDQQGICPPNFLAIVSKKQEISQQ